MSYLIGFHWAWLLLSLVLGAIVGWFTYLRPRTHWMDGLVWLVAALVALGALVAISTIIPGRPGYWLEVALLMAVAYGIGCPIGWALRDQAFSDPASASDHDSRLPKPGYVFQGATLGGTVAAPAAGSDAPVPVATATTASESATPAPIPIPPPSVAAASPEPTIAAPQAPTSVPAPLEVVVPSETTPPPSAKIVEPIPSPPPEPATPAAVPTGIRVVLDEPAEAAPLPVVAAPPPASLAPVAAAPASSVEPAPAPATTPAGAPAEPPRMPPLPDEDRHAGTRPDGFVTARGNGADDLKRIKGIGPQNEGRLHGLGIWHFDQIAAWTPDNVKWVGSYLAFHGRIDREKWIEQAKALALGQDTEVTKRVAAGRAAASNVGGSVKPRKR